MPAGLVEASARLVYARRHLQDAGIARILHSWRACQRGRRLALAATKEIGAEIGITGESFKAWMDELWFFLWLAFIMQTGFIGRCSSSFGSRMFIVMEFCGAKKEELWLMLWTLIGSNNT
ncbi:hypothetical protein NDU88_001259 [Pleurodeles waltl]|uniref:Uncharacterized protein n=1 Tax=Pleurodeles waltl TaxID=8319 RepID=A0AAV7VVX9_PLEWA|nr:hypothetical protein NDU88_001259 [Pleurodeles waltl]